MMKFLRATIAQGLQNGMRPRYYCYALFSITTIGLMFFEWRALGKDKSKYKVDGYLSSELKVENFKNGEVDHQGKIEMETKRKNGFKMEFSVRFRSEDNSAKIREAIVNKEFSSDEDTKIEFGLGKKRFGLEYDSSKRDRKTIDRSPLYRRMEVFTYVGRETQVRWYHKTKDTKRSLTLGHSEAQDSSIVGSSQFKLDPSWELAYWLQLQADHIDDGYQFVWAAMGSLIWHGEPHSFEAETLVGVDPEQSELDKVLGRDERTQFAGLKIQYDYLLPGDEGERWRFISQSTLLYHDLQTLSFNSVQLLVGVSYYLDPVTLSCNLEGIGSTSRVDPKNRSFAESSAKFEVIYEI